MTARESLPAGRLEEIYAREQAASEGPWEAQAIGSEGYIIHKPGQTVRTREPHIARIGDGEWNRDRANAQFLAHAREDVRDLLAEHARLYDELDRQTALAEQGARANRELKRVRAEVARLTEAGVPLLTDALLKARKRVAELESERHVKNEALLDATVAGRAAEARVLREAADAVAAPVPPVTAGPRTERERGRMDAVAELRRLADERAPADAQQDADAEHRAKAVREFVERVAEELSGCCSECDACIDIMRRLAAEGGESS